MIEVLLHVIRVVFLLIGCFGIIAFAALPSITICMAVAEEEGEQFDRTMEVIREANRSNVVVSAQNHICLNVQAQVDSDGTIIHQASIGNVDSEMEAALFNQPRNEIPFL